MVDGPAELQRPVEQVWLCKRQCLVGLILAHVHCDSKGFALAEEIVCRVIDSDKSAGQAAYATRQSDAVLALLSHLEQDVDGCVLGVLRDRGILIGLKRLEVL